MFWYKLNLTNLRRKNLKRMVNKPGHECADVIPTDEKRHELVSQLASLSKINDPRASQVMEFIWSSQFFRNNDPLDAYVRESSHIPHKYEFDIERVPNDVFWKCFKYLGLG
jgi:hypothetical protein